MKPYNPVLYHLYMRAPNRFKNYIRRKILEREGGQMYSPTIREIFKNKYKITVGYGSYGACFSALRPGVTFGNYCSIGEGLRIYRANHPMNDFTTHPLLYSPIGGMVKEDKLKRPPLTIGHDVWMGVNVIVLPQVLTIGNGAVIGAGSVVTKDVAPYSIVAGNPARVIKQRFSDAVICRLEASRWWELDKEEIIRRRYELTKLVVS